MMVNVVWEDGKIFVKKLVIIFDSEIMIDFFMEIFLFFYIMFVIICVCVV